MSIAAVSAVAGVVGKWLQNDASEDQNRTAVDLAVVEATGQIGRILSLLFLFGPDVAPLLPWVEAADVAAYKAALADATPAWEQGAKQAAIFAMWGGSERAIRKAGKARGAKNTNRDTNRDTNTNNPGAGPAGR